MTVEEFASHWNRVGPDRLRVVPLRKERQVAIDVRSKTGQWRMATAALSPTRAEAFILGFMFAEAEE